VISKYSIFFEDLPRAEANTYFAKFCTKWNTGALEPDYYKGIDHTTLNTGTRVKHQW
jgi:hypothetical protein